MFIYIRKFPPLLTFLAVILAIPAYAQQNKHHVQLQIIPERTTIEPGETLLIALEQTLDPDWHTYWVNPGDSGTPARFSWTLPPGFEAGEVRWPTPAKYKEGLQKDALVDFGYMGRFAPLQEITAPQNLPAGPVTLTLKAEILVCKDICIPEILTQNLIFNDGPARDNGAAIDAATNLMPYAVDWPARYGEDKGDFYVQLHLDMPSFMNTLPKMPAFGVLPYENGVIDNTAVPAASLARTDSGLFLTVRQKRGDRPLSDFKKLRVLFTYKDTRGIRQALDFTADPAPQTQAQTPVPAIAPAGDELPIGFLTAFVFAILGGLILNLMPCVFPVLSIKVLSLCKVADKSHGEALRYGLAYAAGIMVCFALFAGALFLLKSAGMAAGWGFQMQNPLVVLILAWLLFVLGLNLSGAYEIGGRFVNLGAGLAAKEGLTGSFFTGVLAAIVATPCTAPFMGTALGYTLTQPPAMTLVVFLALGFGLALPFLLLAAVPALRDRLPKPGPWMESFRHVLALPLYVSAGWLVWVFSHQTSAIASGAALVGMAVFSFCLWRAHRAGCVGASRAALVTAALAVMAFSTAYSLGAFEAMGFVKTPAALSAQGDPAQQKPDVLFSEPWSPQAQAKIEAGDDPLFINMTAAWCITCKINERVALHVPPTGVLFAQNRVHYLKGDWTNQSAAIAAFLMKYGREGVPLYVYIGRRDLKTGVRPKPVVLPQILTPQAIARAIAGPQKGK